MKATIFLPDGNVVKAEEGKTLTTYGGNRRISEIDHAGADATNDWINTEFTDGTLAIFSSIPYIVVR